MIGDKRSARSPRATFIVMSTPAAVAKPKSPSARYEGIVNSNQPCAVKLQPPMRSEHRHECQLEADDHHLAEGVGADAAEEAGKHLLF